MLLRQLLLATTVGLLYAASGVNHADAKGSSAIVAATVSSGTLSAPVTVLVQLPENLDDMFEMDAPSGVDGTTLPYAMTLHYDFAEEGGKRDWVGRYDGESTLYFPESMLVGNGTWAAGWYTAVDVLGAALPDAVGSTDPSLPATGSGPSSVGAMHGVFIMFAMLGLGTLFAGLVLLGRGRALLSWRMRA
jgi:hypothetical protein